MECGQPYLHTPGISNHIFSSGCHQAGRRINLPRKIYLTFKTKNCMKNLSVSMALFLLVLLVSLSGCQLVGDIFKAGVWVGVLVVVAVIGLIIFLISKASGGK
jgi:hypothetical protein